MNHLLINSDLVKQKDVNRSLKSRRFGIIETSTFCASIYINHLASFMWDVPRHITPPNKNKKGFHASQTQINQGEGEAPWLDPWYSCRNFLFDWPAERGWFTSVPFGQNKSNYERTNDISYLEESKCTTAGSKWRNALKVAPNSVSFSLLTCRKVGTRLPIVQKEETAFQWINFYPADDAVGVYLSTG